ncbi:MAG TPA: hypothetical protein VNR59_14265 [Gaiellaceae bacterium]|nr:hypothetical protein [Gaiellaceae bacterium]
MYARLATFEGDPAKFDDVIALLRERTAGDPPPGLENAKFLMLVDRATGKGYGLTLFETEDDRRRGDETLNAEPGGPGKRLSVEFFDVPIQTLS